MHQRYGNDSNDEDREHERYEQVHRPRLARLTPALHEIYSCAHQSILEPRMLICSPASAPSWIIDHKLRLTALDICKAITRRVCASLSVSEHCRICATMRASSASTASWSRLLLSSSWAAWPRLILSSGDSDLCTDTGL